MCGREPAAPYLIGYQDTRSPIGSLSDETALRDFIDHSPPSWCQNSSRFRWTVTFSSGRVDGLVSTESPGLTQRPECRHRRRASAERLGPGPFRTSRDPSDTGL